MDQPFHADMANLVPRTYVPSSQTVSQLSAVRPPRPFAAHPHSAPPHNTNSSAVPISSYSSPELPSRLTILKTKIAIVDLNATSLGSSTGRRISHEQGLTPLLASTTVSSAYKKSSATPAASSSTTPSTEEDVSSHGPLPDWAFFYDPVLSYEQVKYIESQMRPQEEYKETPADQRQSLAVNDLQQALSSMPKLYNKSTQIMANDAVKMSETTSPESILTHAKTMSAHYAVQVSQTEAAILAGRSDVVDPFGKNQDDGNVSRKRKRSMSELEDDDQAPTNNNSNYSAHVHSRNQPNLDHSSSPMQLAIEKSAAIAATYIPSKIATEPPSVVSTPSSPCKSHDEPVNDLARLSSSYIYSTGLANGKHS